MMTFTKILQNRWIMTAAMLGLVLYYLLVFRPLSHRVESLAKPIDDVWSELVEFSQDSGSLRGLDLNQIKKARENLSDSLAATEQMRKSLSARMELEPEIRAKMNEPFFLIDFQNERQKRIEQLVALAKTAGVTLDPAVLNGFPEYKVETRNPSLLWAQLSIAHHVLTVAINSKVARVQKIAFPAPPVTKESAAGKIFWQEIPFHIEVIALMPSGANFLSAMPLRAEEIKAAGLPQSLPDKPALFLDRLIVRKQTPEKVDEVSLDVIISGFIPKSKEEASPAPSKGGNS